jgi:predicted nucleotidyltransferase component of viral defense system
MRLSIEHLTAEAASTSFRPEMLEKVIHLLGLLERFTRHPYLKNRIALKGGTALNLFIFDLPRLSVDIDLNYIGASDRETMLAERPKVEQAITAVCGRQDFSIQRIPEDHAGGKWRLRYDSALGQGGNVEVDLNFMFRVPLWPVKLADSRPIGSHSAAGITLMDEHELAAGKLVALLSRHATRDLFDTHHVLRRPSFDPVRLRLAFVVYGAMSRKDWRTVSLNDIGFEAHELRSTLVPVLRTDHLAALDAPDQWAALMVEETRAALSAVLPFTASEREFLNRILDCGEIEPSLLTDDAELADRISRHPALLWKAQNVRDFRKP